MTPFQFRSALDPNNPDHRRVMVPWDDVVGELAADIGADPVRYPQIYAPRQMGKSTLCLQLMEWIRRERSGKWLACHVDCGAAAGGDVSGVVGLLHDGVLQEALRYARARPSGSDQLVGRLSGLAQPATAYQFRVFLDRVLEMLPEVTRLALIVDEMDSLRSETLYQALCMFRSLHHKYTRGAGAFACCVVAVSWRDLAALRIGPGSPYNVAEPRFTHEATRGQWLAVLERAGCLPFGEEALSRLFGEVGGHPYLLQRLCDRAVIEAERDEAAEVDEGHVLDAIGWLFEKGDRNLRIVSQEADANTGRCALCDRLVQGEFVRFERTLDACTELTDLGLVGSEKHRARFRNRIYERLMLNRRYDSVGGPMGEHLVDYGQLLVRCSEVQRIVLSSDLRKELRPKVAFRDTIAQEAVEQHVGECVKALNESGATVLADLDVPFVNRWLRTVLGEEADLAGDQILEVIARLFVERWQSGSGGGSGAA